MSVRYGSDVVVDLLRRGRRRVRGVQSRRVLPRDPRLARPRGRRPADHPLPARGIAVAVAHGYAKAAGRPMAVLLHDVVGLQNASMAIYNAWCDRVPCSLIGGTGPMSNLSAGRGSTGSTPRSSRASRSRLRQVGRPAGRPRIAAGVVRTCVDDDARRAERPGVPLRRRRHPGAGVPCRFSLEPVHAYAAPTPPSPAKEDVVAIGDALSQARLPVLVTDYAGGTRTGFESLLHLAERLASPVVDCGRRLSFPTAHDLSCGVEVIGDADVILALDVEDPAGVLLGIAPNTRIFNVTPAHLSFVRGRTTTSNSIRPNGTSRRHATPPCPRFSRCAGRAMAFVETGPYGSRSVRRRRERRGARRRRALSRRSRGAGGTRLPPRRGARGRALDARTRVARRVGAAALALRAFRPASRLARRWWARLRGGCRPSAPRWRLPAASSP